MITILHTWFNKTKAFKILLLSNIILTGSCTRVSKLPKLTNSELKIAATNTKNQTNTTPKDNNINLEKYAYKPSNACKNPNNTQAALKKSSNSDGLSSASLDIYQSCVDEISPQDDVTEASFATFPSLNYDSTLSDYQNDSFFH